MLEKQLFEVFIHLLVAMLAGGLIGLERSYNGHAAGFRTHTLVCMASTLLMIIAIYQKDWFSQALVETVRIDPTRMAQGVMTGVGFLGAGVIMRDGLSIRGLTTAASIWITSAIGILVGVGFFGAVFIVLALTLGTLSTFRLVEARLPSLMYAHCSVRLNREQAISEKEVRKIMADHGFDVMNLSYTLQREERKCFTYDMTIRTRKKHHFERLAQELSGLESVLEFRISFTD